ncbi:MAG TPA: M24 family metallopeptidase [Ktedonobacterales bacterium]|nr:M24 family metallopeptidase [Ktedonobacterales bacterium]
MEPQRADRLSALMQRNGFQALVCRIPQHVLMLTGYAPLLGQTFCVVSLNQAGSPEVRLVTPEQEKDLLPQGTALEGYTFSEETLEFISNTIEAAREPLAECLRAAGLGLGTTIGFEGGYAPIVTNYTQVGIPGPATLTMLDLALPGAHWRDATPVLDRLAEIKTDDEIQAIRRSAEAARQGFLAARAAIHVGATEADVAATATAAMLRAGHALAGVRIVQPHAHVMTGARAAEAHKSFNLTTNTSIQRGDTVLVQLEIGIDGYWAELTRPFFAGEVSEEWRRAHAACLQAQQAAFAALRDGAAARQVDAAARQVMQTAGFGEAFKHGLGHGVGFQAIDHADPPVLHPASDAILRAGMVTNIEPAVYLEGKGGIRLNDDVAIRQDGYELLSAATPRELDWLVVD